MKDERKEQLEHAGGDCDQRNLASVRHGRMEVGICAVEDDGMIIVNEFRAQIVLLGLFFLGFALGRWINR